MIESKFQKKVIDLLKDNNCYVINYNPGAVGRGGAPDLMVCINGVFVGIELKVKHKLQARQMLNLKHIEDSGGVGIVFRYTKDWKERLQDLISFVRDMEFNIEIVKDKISKLTPMREWVKELMEIKWD